LASGKKINRISVRNVTQTAAEVAELAQVRKPIRAHADVLSELPIQQHARHPRLDDVLPKHHFIKHLRREKSRTDRSRAPLSIVLFDFSGKKGNSLPDVRDLLELLHTTKREADIVGYLREDLIAILLPDTNEHGVQRLAAKIVNGSDNLPFSTITRTYPDQLFEKLITENQALLELYPFFLNESRERTESEYALKRTLDIIGSLAAIALLAPVMLLTALAISLTSPGPVIFRQIRLGKSGTPFVFLKFRSMVCNADDRIHRQYVASLIDGDLQGINQGDAEKPLYKMKSDPRVTLVGQFIRKTSIDELPQLFNVLKGDMSLVGPRPALPYEVERYQPWHLRRILEIRPGITGLWQVEGRSKTSFDDMVRLDLRYIRSCSLVLDLKILIRTVKVVLQCDGAG
jgi:exopolysaccharide biosynthesis polyprenyl glycosylphosphotransferase